MPCLRSAALLFSAVLLSACLPVIAPTGPTKVDVLEGALTVAAPRGYCVDPETAQAGPDSAVVLMGRCTALVPAAPALLTVSVGPAASGGVMAGGGQTLAAFFTSPQGRATLARSGRAEDVTVSRAVGAGDAFLMQIADRKQGNYWRAIVALKGRLVTLSVAGTPESPLSVEAGRDLLDQALAALRTANP